MRNIINVKKSLFMATALATLIAGGISAAQAAAVRSDPNDCGLLDGNGGVVFPVDAKVTATPSANDNATVQCRADVTPAKSGEAVQFNYNSTGFLCGVPDAKGAVQMTQRWEETVSASGNATITCHYP